MFQPGDKVLVLLPIPGNLLQGKLHGPYVIEQQLGSVDYVVSTPDRRKAKCVCHVNLLTVPRAGYALCHLCQYETHHCRA